MARRGWVGFNALYTTSGDRHATTSFHPPGHRRRGLPGHRRSRAGAAEISHQAHQDDHRLPRRRADRHHLRALADKRLRDAFKHAMEQPAYVDALKRYDMVPIYMDSAQYRKFAEETFVREKALIEKMGLAKAK
ncbi:MAG: hypothetical protein IPG65_04090 [Ottowia sp.]|nr:hypothetical protein [Ottowia sp.]